MPKKKLNYNIIFKEINKQKEQESYILEKEDIEEYNEIRELREIVLEIQASEQKYLTST